MKKSKRGHSNPHNYCPVCGENWGDHINGACKKKHLGAIDAANTRAERDDDNPSEPGWYPPTPNFLTRLAEGFRILHQDPEE
jgi:hypothetical protein